MYAIDSLRQLGVKFLEIPELESYSFQKEFLQPFVLIMQNNSTEDVHELVIRCLQQVIDARCQNLKSGWETILRVLSLAATDSFQSIATVGSDIMDTMMEKHFKHASEPFHKFTSCLVAYGVNPLDTNIAEKAINHLKTTTERLAAGDIVPPNKQGKYDDSETHARHWLACMSSLCAVAWDPRTQIRSRALDVIFEVIREHGSLWTIELWKMIFDRALYPMFDACKTGAVNVNEKSRDDWLKKSCEGALQQLVDVYCHHLLLLRPYMEEFLMYIYTIVAQPNLQLSTIGMHTLSYLIDKLGGEQASNEQWDVMLSVVKKIFDVSTPRDFVQGAVEAAAAEATLGVVSEAAPVAENSDVTKEPYGSAAEKASPRSAVIMIPGKGGAWEQPTAEQFDAMKLMCTVQLLMINAVGEVWCNHGKNLLSRHILILVEALEGATSFAHEFNINRGARTKLWNPDLINTPPQLIEQEIQALGVYLSILFSLYGEKEVEKEVRHNMAEDRLMKTINVILERYITKTLKPTLVPEEVPEMMAFTPVVIQILQGIQNFGDDQLKKHLPALYMNVVEMTSCSKNEARALVKDILIRVGTLKGLV